MSYEEFQRRSLRSGLNRDFAPAQLARLYASQNQGDVQQSVARRNNADAESQEHANVHSNPHRSADWIDEQMADQRQLATQRQQGYAPAFAEPRTGFEAPQKQVGTQLSARTKATFNPSIFGARKEYGQGLGMFPSSYADGKSIKNGVHQYGMVEGKGTGISDSVGPAALPGSGEVANLSNGEAVLPEDTVNYLNEKAFGGDPEGLEKLILATHKKPQDNNRWRARKKSVGGDTAINEFEKNTLGEKNMGKQANYRDGKRYDSGATGLSKMIENVARATNRNHPMNKLDNDLNLREDNGVRLDVGSAHNTIKGRQSRLEEQERRAMGYADGRGLMRLKKPQAVAENNYADGKAEPTGEKPRARMIVDADGNTRLALGTVESGGQSKVSGSTKNYNYKPGGGKGRSGAKKAVAEKIASTVNAVKDKFSRSDKKPPLTTGQKLYKGAGALAILGAGGAAVNGVIDSNNDAAARKQRSEAGATTKEAPAPARAVNPVVVDQNGVAERVGRFGERSFSAAPGGNGVSNNTQWSSHTGGLREQAFAARGEADRIRSDYIRRGLDPNTSPQYQAAMQRANSTQDSVVAARHPLQDPTSEMFQAVLAAGGGKGGNGGKGGSKMTQQDVVEDYNANMKAMVDMLPEDQRFDAVRNQNALGQPTRPEHMTVDQLAARHADFKTLRDKIKTKGELPANFLQNPAEIQALMKKLNDAGARERLGAITPGSGIPLSDAPSTIWNGYFPVTSEDGAVRGYTIGDNDTFNALSRQNIRLSEQ